MDSEHKKTEKKRHKLQGDAFRRVEAAAQGYIKAREDADAAVKAAEKAMWAAAKAEVPSLDTEDSNCVLNREYAAEEIIFIEEGGECQCPMHRAAGLAGLLRPDRSEEIAKDYVKH